MNVEVLIPFSGEDPDRLAALKWVGARLPYPVTIAPGGEPWNKGAALWPAIRESEADVIVLSDADVWCPGLPGAIAEVAGGHPWAIPHRPLHRLSRDGTARLLAGAQWEGLPLDQPVYEGLMGGGIVVARREVLLDCPVPPVVGWGQEDEAHAFALWTLHGPCWRGAAPLVHLWHPPQERLDRRIGSEASWSLYRAYRQARCDPAVMLALVAEAHRRLDVHWCNAR